MNHFLTVLGIPTRFRPTGNRSSAQSDVDLFFDYQKGKLGLFELMEVRDLASSILGAKVDITTRDGLHRLLRPQIEHAALRVF